MIKGAIIGFVIGAVLALGVVYLAVIPNIKAQQAQAGEAEREAGQLRSQVATLQNQVQTLTAQRDSWASKFERATILYDIGLLGAETRAWIIPADVEPKLVGIKRGTFSHYDPKTQMETVHLQPAQVK